MSDLLTEDQMAQVLLAALSEDPKTEDQLQVVVQWAHEAMVSKLLLEDVLRGKIGIKIDDGVTEPDCLKFYALPKPRLVNDRGPGGILVR